MTGQSYPRKSIIIFFQRYDMQFISHPTSKEIIGFDGPVISPRMNPAFPSGMYGSCDIVSICFVRTKQTYFTSKLRDLFASVFIEHSMIHISWIMSVEIKHD